MSVYLDRKEKMKVMLESEGYLLADYLKLQTDKKHRAIDVLKDIINLLGSTAFHGIFSEGVSVLEDLTSDIEDEMEETE